MEGLNRVILAGNLGADPELRMTGKGSAVLNLRMATSRTYLTSDKKRQEETEWHNVVVWGKRAEGLGKVLGKGHRILVEGRLQTTSYEDREGVKRYRTQVVAEDVLLQGRPEGTKRERERERDRDDDGAPPDAAADGAVDDDDIPF